MIAPNTRRPFGRITMKPVVDVVFLLHGHPCLRVPLNIGRSFCWVAMKLLVQKVSFFDNNPSIQVHFLNESESHVARKRKASLPSTPCRLPSAVLCYHLVEDHC